MPVASLLFCNFFEKSNKFGTVQYLFTAILKLNEKSDKMIDSMRQQLDIFGVQSAIFQHLVLPNNDSGRWIVFKNINRNHPFHYSMHLW